MLQHRLSRLLRDVPVQRLARHRQRQRRGDLVGLALGLREDDPLAVARAARAARAVDGEQVDEHGPAGLGRDLDGERADGLGELARGEVADEVDERRVGEVLARELLDPAVFVSIDFRFFFYLLIYRLILLMR